MTRLEHANYLGEQRLADHAELHGQGVCGGCSAQVHYLEAVHRSINTWLQYMGAADATCLPLMVMTILLQVASSKERRWR